jgi:hypothetical protein
VHGFVKLLIRAPATIYRLPLPIVGGFRQMRES